MLFPMYGVFYLTTFSSVHDSKFQVQQARFHAQSIKGSPVMTAHKAAKLSTFFVIDQLNIRRTIAKSLVQFRSIDLEAGSQQFDIRPVRFSACCVVPQYQIFGGFIVQCQVDIITLSLLSMLRPSQGNRSTKNLMLRKDTQVLQSSNLISECVKNYDNNSL